MSRIVFGVSCVMLAVGLALAVATEDLVWLASAVLSSTIGEFLRQPRSRRTDGLAEPATSRSTVASGAMLALAGLGTLWYATGETSLAAIRAAGVRDLALMPPDWRASDSLLVSGVFATVGLLALGGFSPFHRWSPRNESLPSAAASVLRRLTALAILLQLVSRTLPLLDPRAETILIALALIGWIVPLITRRPTMTSATDVFVLQSQAWLAGLCVVAWETTHAGHSLSIQSAVPDGVRATLFCMAADVLAYAVCLTASTGGLTSRGGGISAGVARAALAGFPPFPGFWGRLWLLIACIFSHQIAPLSGVPDIHFAMMALAVALVLGTWNSGLRVFTAPDNAADTAAAPVPMRPKTFIACIGAAILVACGLYPQALSNLTRFPIPVTAKPPAARSTGDGKQAGSSAQPPRNAAAISPSIRFRSS